MFRKDMKDSIKKEVKHVVEKIDWVEKKVNKKMDLLEKKVNDQGESMLIELSGMRGDLERVKSKVGNSRGAFEDKFPNLEERILTLELNKNLEHEEENRGPFLIDTTCVITGIPFVESEDLLEKCLEFIRRGLELDDIEVVNMVCVGRREGSLGVVKKLGQFQSAKNKDAESKGKIAGQREIQEMVSMLQQAIRTETARIANN